jgi:hypothetical protein
MKRFLGFQGKRHPPEMGEREVEAFPSHLAVEDGVATSAQKQSMSALLFLTIADDSA